MTPAAAAAGLGDVEGQDLIETCVLLSIKRALDLPANERPLVFVGIEILLRVFGEDLLNNTTYAAPINATLVYERTGRTPT